MPHPIRLTVAAMALLVGLAPFPVAADQSGQDMHHTMSPGMNHDAMDHGNMDHGTMNHEGMAHVPGDHGRPIMSLGAPTLPGQDAFGAIAEIIAILEADPNTDWSRVKIGALREHLVDMNRLTLDARATEIEIDGGLDIMIIGDGGTLRAIRTMVTAHAPMLAAETGWTARAEKTDNGARLVVTATTPRDVAKIRALGFFGLMATGAHHQTHHLGMARGEMVHQ